MSKSVLISIQPEYCQLIADGYKIAEVRKNFPKLETPFKVYIYCTKGKGYSPDIEKGKVIGEFLCEFIEKFPYSRNGYGIEAEDQLCEEACLDGTELYRYLNGATPYAWYISDLVIYETPKELSEFGRYGKSLICSRVDCNKCVHWKYMRINTDEYDYDCECNGILDNFIPLKKPPQSWCYVNETK